MKIKHTLLIILFVTLFMSVAALAVIGINKLSNNLSNEILHTKNNAVIFTK